MKVSVSRLRQLVSTTLSTEGIAEALTMAGLEVEEISPVAPAFTGVHIAEIVDVQPHPGADKLKVCTVNVGEGRSLQIVCGAPNARAGMKAPCAVVGAKLPDFEIKAAKLRGIESLGMLCSARELGLSDDHGGLLELPHDAPVGENIRAWLELDDEILTLKITPNRGDCLSIWGVARDLAAATGSAFVRDEIQAISTTGQAVREVSIVHSEACGQYFGRILTGLNPDAQSPGWLKKRLERAGLRPISPLVDITNLVMIEMGQPMHAFDHGKLRGPITVRFARSGESLKLLTGVDAELDESILTICDESGPVAAGGVMGGESTMCTSATTSVFFESAWFAPDAIRGKAQRLGVTSDAAYRFERGVDPSVGRAAIEWATALARSICGTSKTEIGPMTIANGRLPTRSPIDVRLARTSQLIGMEISGAEQQIALKRIGCDVHSYGNTLQVIPPTHRFDLAIEEDFIEEIARIHGYSRIPDRLPISSLPMVAKPSQRLEKSQLKSTLARMGFFEAITYSFVDPQWEEDFCGNMAATRLLNPIASHMAVMRSSLIGGLVGALRGNLAHGEARIKHFEIGRCFLSNQADTMRQPERLGLIAAGSRYPEQWGEGGQKGQECDFYTLKGEVESLLDPRTTSFCRVHHPALHPGRAASIQIAGADVGIIGELHPRWVQKYELRHIPIVAEIGLDHLLSVPNRRFEEFSRQQSLRRDISICLDSQHSIGVVLAAVEALKIKEIQEFVPFDIYRGAGLPPGQKSVALRVVMQDTERTLTDSDADSIRLKIVKVLGEKFGATLRK